MSVSDRIKYFMPLIIFTLGTIVGLIVLMSFGWLGLITYLVWAYVIIGAIDP